ncbi:MAG: MATE family efflux transporter [Chlorobi bacterium]|nr:MATE family efflux transporter [Chlorobiota bacterium]
MTENQEDKNNTAKSTQGVKTLLSTPEKAIRKLSGPMIIAMSVQTLYNIIDSIWVAGLGSDKLAAIGLFFPVFMIIISLASGISIGGSSAISRKIGAKDKQAADSAAGHTLFMGAAAAIFILIFILPFLKTFFIALGAEISVAELIAAYGKIIVGGSAILIFNNIAGGILRGEGDTKRVMYAMSLGSVLNIILDPLFIYTFKMGINGAAWATLTSMSFTAALNFYWLFIKKNTYTTFKLKTLKLNKKITSEILKVGIPASLAQMSMALAIFIINYFIVISAGTNGVAVFTGAWRIIMIGLVPLLGISAGVTAVTGAAFGARNIKKLKTGYFYGIKIGIITEILITTFIIILSPQLTYLFTHSGNTAHISEIMQKTLIQLALFLPFVPAGMFTSSMFQGIGKGEYSLAITIMRTLVFQILFVWLFGIKADFGLSGISAGIVTGNITASLIAFVWGQLTIKKLKINYQKPKN